MSSAAMARRKRAAAPVPPPQSQSQSYSKPQTYSSQAPPSAEYNSPQNTSAQNGKGMTIHQVVNLIDTRLKVLEDFREESLRSKEYDATNTVESKVSIITVAKDAQISAIQAIETATDNSIRKLQAFSNKFTAIEETQTSAKSAILDESVTQEYESRFSMLVTEINELKDMLLKVQSFTMEVNKSLMEERLDMMKSVHHTIQENTLEEMNCDIGSSSPSSIEQKSTLDTIMEDLQKEDEDTETQNEILLGEQIDNTSQCSGDNISLHSENVTFS
jgi:uncharacterized coiled-coil protein SlyX